MLSQITNVINILTNIISYRKNNFYFYQNFFVIHMEINSKEEKGKAPISQD